MRIIDLDAVDWSQCPRELLDMASIEDVKQFLNSQPNPIVVPISYSNNANVRAAATLTAMHFNQALISMYPLMVEMVNEKQKKGDAQE